MKSKVAAIMAGIVLVAIVALQTSIVYATAPFFNPQAVSIPESSPNNTAATPKLSAFDAEDGAKVKFFEEAGGTGGALFDVDQDGTVRLVAGPIDYEATQSYTLNIRAEDTTPPIESATAIVTINVTNVSDVSPTVDPQDFDIAENSPNNTVVGTIQVTDSENDPHVFTATGGSGQAIFDVNTSTGQIRVTNAAVLDYETPPNSYTLNISVDDVGGSSPANATMTINVTDVDEAPVFSAIPALSVPENSPNATVVGNPIQAVDPEGAAVSYSIVGSTPFAINSTTGQITVNNSSQLDYEALSPPQIKITVKATDQTNKSSTADVTITVTNVNDKPKTIGIPDQVVNEGAAPKNVNLWGYFSDDEDADDDLIFTEQANSNTGLVTVEINNTTGNMKLTFAANGAGIANITIRATDTQAAFVDSTFKVDINDAPTTIGIGDFSVNEDAPNTTINLHDVFSDAEDSDADLTYAIVSNSNGGLVAASLSLPNLVLDYVANANGNANITVKATDTGGLSVQTTFKVTVIAVNDKPTTTGLNDVQVMEDAPDKTIPLFPAFADDEDEDDEMTYVASVTAGDAGLFVVNPPSINPTTGILTLKFKPNTSGEATLKVEATDTGGLKVDTSFKVTVGSAADRPVVSDFSRSTDEDVILAFSKQDFVDHFVDDDGEPLVKVKIVSLPAKGVLKRGAVTLKAGDEISASDLNDLTFTPELNWNTNTGTTSFQWNASDGTDYAVNPAKVTISAKPINDPPVVSDFTKVGDEDKTINFANTDFSSISAYDDVEGSPLASVRIETIPTNGTLKLGPNNITANQTINAGNLDTLKFIPDSNWSGSTSFDWNGSDGDLFALVPAKVNITINAKNDPPVIDLNGPDAGTGYTALFNSNAGPTLIVGPNVTLTDPDGGMLDAIYVEIDKVPDGASELLDANKSGTDINISFNPAKRTLTLKGPDTLDNFIKVLKTVTYGNSSKTPDPSQRTIKFQAYDGQAYSDTAITKVDVVRPAIALTVDKPFQTVISGDTAVFTLTIVNTGDVDLKEVTLTSPVADCNKGLVKPTLGAGDALPPIVCAATNVTGRIDNVLVVTAEDTTGGPPVTSTVTAVVKVSNPNIRVEILADPLVGYTVAKGSDVPLIVTVENPSQAKLKEVTLTATLEPIVAGEEGRSTRDVDLPSEMKCTFEGAVFDLAGAEVRDFTCTISNVVAPLAFEVNAIGTIEGTVETVHDFDRATINVLDISMQATSDLFEIPAGNATDVEFIVTLTNEGNKPVTLTELTSRTTSDQLLHGNLLDANNTLVKDSTCTVAGNAPVLDANGGTFACTYVASVLAEVPSFTNRISFTVTDEEANEFSSSQDIELFVNDESGVRAILNANPATLIAPGGDIELLVQIRNNSNGPVALEGLTDSQEGDLNGLGDCEVPQEIASDTSYLCSYTVSRDGLSAGDELKFVLTATVNEDLYTDDVVVKVTERGTRRAIFPVVTHGAVVGEPNNRCLDAMLLMPSLDNYFFADDLDDWYRVVIRTPGTLRVHVSNYQVDGQLLVYVAPDCSSISNDEGKHFSDGSGLPEKNVLLANAQPGTYFIRVYGSKQGETGPVNTSPIPYGLRVDLTNP